jgi:hypothetical protein
MKNFNLRSICSIANSQLWISKIQNVIGIFFSIALIAFIGCGEKLPADLPKLYPTTLTVVQENQPLGDAIVQVTAKDRNSKWSATGITNASGVVELDTQGKYKGVPEGIYSVVVTKTFTETPKYAGQSQPKDVSYEEWQKMLAADVSKSYNLVDLKFGSLETTTLEIKITPSGNNNQKIDVGKSIREEIKMPQN